MYEITVLTVETTNSQPSYQLGFGTVLVVEKLCSRELYNFSGPS